MTSKEARGFIARKIAKNLDEGYSPKVAVGRAYGQARSEGYKIPVPAHIRRAERNG